MAPFLPESCQLNEIISFLKTQQPLNNTNLPPLLDLFILTSREKPILMISTGAHSEKMRNKPSIIHLNLPTLLHFAPFLCLTTPPPHPITNKQNQLLKNNGNHSLPAFPSRRSLN